MVFTLSAVEGDCFVQNNIFALFHEIIVLSWNFSLEFFLKCFICVNLFALDLTLKNNRNFHLFPILVLHWNLMMRFMSLSWIFSPKADFIQSHFSSYWIFIFNSCHQHHSHSEYFICKFFIVGGLLQNGVFVFVTLIAAII